MRSHTRPSIFSRLRALALALALLLAPLLSLTLTTPAVAASPIVVNDLGDDTTGGNSSCTLREALTNANTNSDTTGGDCGAGSGADTISFSVSGTITLGSTLPAIDDKVTIDGTGRSIIVSGNNSVEVMFVNFGKMLNLRELTIAHGSCNCSGGGINNRGTLTVTNSTFADNSSTQGAGAISNSNGTLTVTTSTFSNNRATGSGNGGAGGAIINSANSTLSVINSTFTNNSANLTGGAIVNFGIPGGSNGTLNVLNTTFSGNSADNGVGGIENTGTTTLKNTIVANNPGGDCHNAISLSTLTADAFNLDSDGSCNNATTKTQAQINLGPLASNGGSTQTMALGEGSAAIDAGDDAVCPSSDQRGVSRPQGAHCDIGAFELGDSTPPLITSNVVGTLGSNGWYVSDVTVSWSVTDAESAISSQTGCDPSTVTSDTAGGTFTCTASSAGGTSSKGVTIKRDATAPTLAPIVSPNPLRLGQSGSASPNASDALSGIASQSCAPLDTSSVGVKSVSCIATDLAGNSASASASYEVLPPLPTMGVLDTFDRANGAVGSNWAGLIATSFYKVASNRLDVQAGGPLVWKPTSFGSNQEAFVTLSAIDPKSRSQGVLLKVQSGSIPDSGALAVVYDAVAKAVRVSTLRLGQNGAWTLYANQAATFANGDVLGAQALSSGEVRIYKNGAQIATVTLNAADGAFFNAKGGKIGIWSAAAPNAFFDDFGGGTANP